MANPISVRSLQSDGKLHSRLIFQLRLLTAISLILLAVVVYQIIAHNLSILISGAIAIFGFVLGLFVFSKMNKLVWNEEEEVIKTARMEALGIVILFLYIAFEVGLRRFLAAEYSGTFAATAYLFAGIGASLLGRSLGTVIAIRKLAKEDTNPL